MKRFVEIGVLDLAVARLIEEAEGSERDDSYRKAIAVSKEAGAAEIALPFCPVCRVREPVQAVK
jgi:hypothetical protein